MSDEQPQPGAGAWDTMTEAERQSAIESATAEWALERTRGAKRQRGSLQAPRMPEKLFEEAQAAVQRRLRAGHGLTGTLLHAADGSLRRTPTATLAFMRRWRSTAEEAYSQAHTQHCEQAQAAQATAEATNQPPPAPPEPSAGPTPAEWVTMSAEQRGAVIADWTATWADQVASSRPYIPGASSETIPDDLVARWQSDIGRRISAAYGSTAAPWSPASGALSDRPSPAAEWGDTVVQQYLAACERHPLQPPPPPRPGTVPGALRPPPGPSASEWAADQARQRQERAQAKADETQRLRLSRAARGRVPGSV
jgi:hypothetical protein